MFCAGFLPPPFFRFLFLFLPFKISCSFSLTRQFSVKYAPPSCPLPWDFPPFVSQTATGILNALFGKCLLPIYFESAFSSRLLTLFLPNNVVSTNGSIRCLLVYPSVPSLDPCDPPLQHMILLAFGVLRFLDSIAPSRSSSLYSVRQLSRTLQSEPACKKNVLRLFVKPGSVCTYGLFLSYILFFPSRLFFFFLLSPPTKCITYLFF